MQPLQYTVALLSLAASVLAECYEKGHNQDNQPGDGQQGAGLESIKQFDNVAELMYGRYIKGEDRQQCAMDPLGNKWNFYIRNDRGEDTYVYKENVLSWLHDEAFCRWGGENTRDKMFVVADPNGGQCADTHTLGLDGKQITARDSGLHGAERRIPLGFAT